MITNWKMEPVWLEGVVFTSEHDTDVGGMVLGRVEIGIVSDEDWHGHSNLVDVDQGLHGGELHRIAITQRRERDKILPRDHRDPQRTPKPDAKKRSKHQA